MKIIKPHNRYSTTTYWRRVNGGILSCILIEHKCNKLGAKLPEKISPQTQNQNRLVMSETSVLAELPFFSATDDELLGIAEEDLLLDGFQNQKFPRDGFVSFHSLKICCSNAKQMARFLEYSMGFKQVAYRGLESDSRNIASHVVSNGDVVFELVNTLGFSEDVSAPSTVDNPNLDSIREEAVQHFDSFIGDFIHEVVEAHLGKNEFSDFTMAIEEAAAASRVKRSQIQSYNAFLKDIALDTLTTIHDMIIQKIIQIFVSKHGDGVFDISLCVQDVDFIYDKAIREGAVAIFKPRISSDENGLLKLATVRLPSTDICHTLIEHIDYSGPFLPGYVRNIEEESVEYTDQLSQLPAVNLCRIDHCVQNYTWNQMMDKARLYTRIFGLHKYWSVDETDVATENTALRSIVMASSNGRIKIPINEPFKGKKRGQIEEFYDFNGGPGVQHIALLTTNIISTVGLLIQRGVTFNSMGNEYYDELRERLHNDDIILKEALSELHRLNILVDYDSSSRRKKDKGCNYILQIFTKPLHDRPTLFIEIIQRHHHNGFGKGTFKGLFKSIEEQQEKRGTLVDI